MKNCKDCNKLIWPQSTRCKSCAYKGNQWGLGKTISKLGRFNISKAKLGKKNPMWKGDKVTYGSLHDWIKWHKQKSPHCENCKQVKKLDLANISGKYKRDLSDWEWLCRRCHMIKDGRLEKFRQLHKKVG